MSAHGPYGRYAPVRGTQKDLLAQLRRGDWTAGVPALAVQVGRPERNVWLALGALEARELVKHRQTEAGGMRIWITRLGRGLRL